MRAANNNCYMAYYPHIRDFKRFYIQTSSDSSAIDIAEQYGIIAKTHPLVSLPQVKSPASNDWYDENGTDEYTDKLYYQSIDYSVDFYLKTRSAESFDDATNSLHSSIRSFFNKIGQGDFSFYDEATRQGKQKVRYDSGNYEDNKIVWASDNEYYYARCIFSITFKINDPITNIGYNSGVLSNRIAYVSI